MKRIVIPFVVACSKIRDNLFPLTLGNGGAKKITKTTKLWLVMLVVAAGWAVQCSASVIQTNAFNGSETFFDANILNNDLLTSASLTASPNAIWPATNSNDGTAAAVYYNGPLGGVDLLFTLAGSETGYDLTSISGIYGFSGASSRFADQEWAVSVSTVANPTLTLLNTVAYEPFVNNSGAGSSQVTLTDTTGVLASGVTAINFHLSISAEGLASQPTGSVEIGILRELDVVGAATVPEPSTWAMMIAGLGTLIGFQRARRRSNA